MPTRVLLADDHAMFREGIKALLDAGGDFEVVAEAGDGIETIKMAKEHTPDIAVIDYAMPLLSGADAARNIRKASPDIKIIIFSMHADRMYVVEALKAGADGYLLKEESFENLTVAINTVVSGKIYLSDSLGNLVVEDFVRQIRSGEMAASTGPLTHREMEVLQLVTEGKSSREIAELLCVSPSTIDSHRKKIMDKLGIHDTAGLVKYAIKNKIVSI